jgi:hypothetical protein
MARRGGARVAGEAMAVEAERVMGDQLLPLPLTERSAHLCVDFFGRRSLADALDGPGRAGRGGTR